MSPRHESTGGDPWVQNPGDHGQDLTDTENKDGASDQDNVVESHEHSDSSSNPCDGSNEVYHPHPKSHSLFIMCVHGSPFVMPCPDNSKWKNVVLGCVFPIDL